MYKNNIWYDDDTEQEDESSSITEYDITASPNDFNIMTIFSFIERGVVKIPGFQRNYVWDIKRASKLIESIIIGLPIPQIFLYEYTKNEFLVIDGQQRLLTIYYFIKQRFPKEEKRAELREIFDREGIIPDKILHDDNYFVNFNLRLPSTLPNKENKFNKLNFSTLGEYRTIFDLRTIRNIIIKQNSPEDDSSMYEIFNRLNTGGLNLKPQEIRTSLFHSPFYEMLARINLYSGWRRLTKQANPDINMKDIEFLLRGFAMLFKSKEYKPSMVKFLNNFSKQSRKFSSNEIEFAEKLFISFVDNCSELDENAFINRSGKFSVSIYESIFTAICEPHLNNATLVDKKISSKSIEKLKKDGVFIESTLSNTASKENVKERIAIAKEILKEN